MTRSILRTLAAAALVLIALANIWQFHQNLGYLPTRGNDDLSIWEARLVRVRDALLRQEYRGGDLGYMPAGVLKGNPKTNEEDVAWVQARYTLIPYTLKQNTLDAPYVILDFHASPVPKETPPGYVVIFDDPNGLILIKKQGPQ